MGLVKMSIATLLGFDKLPQALQQVLVAVESELLTKVNTTVSATESHVEEMLSDTIGQIATTVKAIPLATMSEIDVDLTLSIGGVSIPLKGIVKLK